MGVDFSESSQSTEQKVLNFFFHHYPSEDAETEGGCMVKEQDFEAENVQIIRKK